MVKILALRARGRIGFFSGDVSKIQEEAHTLKPTVLFSVPRVLARIRQRIYQAVVGSKLKEYFLDMAINRKLKSVDK